MAFADERAHRSRVTLPQLLEQMPGRINSSDDTARQIQERRAKVEAIYHEARKKRQAWIEKTWDEKPISQARLFGEINNRVQGQPWALVSAHGRRWREVIEVTEPAHGIGGGSGGASATACHRPSARRSDTKAAVASA